jgi:thiamine-phosphate pyrophosphorylase
MTARTDLVDLGPGAPLRGPARTKIRIPSGVVLLTDRRVARGGLVRVVAAAVAGGVRWVVLREKELPRVERLALADELRSILTEAGGTLIISGPDPLTEHGDPDRDALGVTADTPGADIADACPDIRPGANGASRSAVALHLSAAGPYPPPAADLIGRSCHDTAELRRLTTEDYVTLSPVFPTRTKPGYGPPLLPAGLAELIQRSPVPSLALGGIETPAQVHACVQAGACGVAVLGTIMRAHDPQQTAATLTAAFHATPPPAPSSRHVPVDPSTKEPEPPARHARTTLSPSTRHISAGDDHDGAAADRNHKTTPDQEELP